VELVEARIVEGQRDAVLLRFEGDAQLERSAALALEYRRVGIAPIWGASWRGAVAVEGAGQHSRLNLDQS